MPEDAETVAPRAYKVLVANDRVRVLEFRGDPGAKIEMHSHPNLVAVAIKDGKIKFTLADGPTIEAELTAGEAMYSEAIVHSTEVLGTSEAHALLVELK